MEEVYDRLEMLLSDDFVVQLDNEIVDDVDIAKRNAAAEAKSYGAAAGHGRGHKKPKLLQIHYTQIDTSRTDRNITHR